MKGLGIIGADVMGGSASSFLSGVPVSIGNTTSPGSIIGENLHTNTAAEMPVHYHSAGIFDPTHSHTYVFPVDSGARVSGTGNLFLPGQQNTSTANSTTGVRVNSPNGLDTTYSAGGGGAHNTVERNMTVYWNLKL